MKIKLVRNYRYFQFVFGICFSSIIAVNAPVAKAQVISDQTLKNESSTIKIDNIKGITSDVIEGGVIRGTNLFHSFSEFNVAQNRGVYFSNPADINNILARITGINASNILGTLGVLGNANLFLINPNGINFGTNANLDVKGSFVASTAERILLNNYDFSASNPTAPPLLNINIPIGLGFRDNPGNITLTNASLKVTTGKTLALIGGNINVDNRGIISPGSQVELGGLTQAGIVDLRENLSLGFPESVTRGNLTLTNGAEVNVRSGGGGSITINSQNLDMTGVSKIRAGIASGLGSPDAQAGNIEINNTGKITIDSSIIDNVVLSSAQGNAGDINIKTGSLEVKNSAYLDTSTSGKGNAGNINITALTGDVIFQKATESDYAPIIYTSIYTSTAQGSGGNVNININNGSLVAKNVAIQTQNRRGTGNAGNVNLKVSDSITFDYSDIASGALTGTVGNGGNIHITANQLILNNNSVFDTNAAGIGNAGNIDLYTDFLQIKDSSQIYANTSGIGNGGNIKFISNNISLDNGQIFSRVNTQGKGNGGNINIQTNSLALNNDAQISVSTSGNGNAGSVEINARDNITFDNGSTILSRVNSNPEAIGNGGDITIKTDALQINNVSQIQAMSFGRGNAGNVNFYTKTMKIDGFGTVVGTLIGTSRGIPAKGNAGDININTDSLFVTNGASLIASLGGEGKGGNININASNLVKFDGLWTVAENAVEFTGVGNAGNINIKSGSLEVTNNAYLRTNTSGKGNGGNINITAKVMVIFADGLFTGASSSVDPVGVGNGGDIQINTTSLEIKNDAELGTSTFGKGNAGNIIINATGNINIQSRGIFSDVLSNAIGNAGNIEINTPALSLSNSSQVNASTSGKGKAGNIIINANQLDIKEKGEIVSITESSEKAGDIILNIVDSINLINGNILANTTPNSTGDGGNIIIDPIFVNLSDGSRIAVNSQGSGNGGNIDLTADNLTLNNNSEISANTFSGEGGNIILSIDNLLRLNNSLMTTEAGGTGNGGNITINTDFLISRNDSDIIANAFAGNGGNIKITTNAIFLTPESNITASSQLGIDGTVEINTPGVDPSQGLIELPENIEDPTKLIAENVCRQGTNSQFYITGRGGFPVTPNHVLETNTVNVQLVKPAQSLAATVNSEPNTKTTSQEIVPARGWVVNEDGNLTLVGYDPSRAGLQRQGDKKLVCTGTSTR